MPKTSLSLWHRIVGITAEMYSNLWGLIGTKPDLDCNKKTNACEDSPKSWGLSLVERSISALRTENTNRCSANWCKWPQPRSRTSDASPGIRGTRGPQCGPKCDPECGPHSQPLCSCFSSFTDWETNGFISEYLFKKYFLFVVIQLEYGMRFESIRDWVSIAMVVPTE